MECASQGSDKRLQLNRFKYLAMGEHQHHSQPQIVIFGAGSIGCYLGGCLSHAGANVTLIGRPRLQKEIAASGLTVTDWLGRNETIPGNNVQFELSPECLSNADFVLLTVKSGDTLEAAKAIEQHCKPNTTIVSLQNGLRNVDVLKQHLPDHNIVKAMVPFNVLAKGQGHFHCGTEGNLAMEGSPSELEPLTTALEKAALPVNLHTDLSGIQWGKLLMNLNNSVNALSGIPLKEQLENRTYRRVMANVVKEALAILNAANIKPARTGKVIPALMPYILSLPNGLFKIAAGATLKIDPQARSSMYEDLALHRKTEIDYLNGEIVQLASQLGLSSPANSYIVERVKAAEDLNKGSPNISAETLLRGLKENLDIS